jgi:hypothetical protein
MSTLPIIHMTLYKHGVGYFRRRGAVSGEAASLTFRREDMDDLLKSLTIIDHSEGKVRGVDYDTPQTQAERLAGCSIILSDTASLRDLLKALRGRAVALSIKDGSAIEGTLLGLDEGKEPEMAQHLVSLLRADSDTVAVLPLGRIEGVSLHDETAAADLRFFLRTALGQETHRSITIRLSPGEHDLEVSYIAPAPTWRVSYRLVTEEAEALLQGWGIFDNRLEEDLSDISLSLTAGMPISFIYDLYTPHTPERPVVEDEDRVAAGPIMFEATALADEEPKLARAGAMPPARMMAAAPAPGASPKAMAASVESAASGEALGELFQYNVSTPVSVGRGQSAMAPIVSSSLQFKKDLIYNGAKMPTHPVATIRFNNDSGLTLERGPVTVLEKGEYVGEAVLPFTADKGEAVVSYAVELGLHVKETVKTERRLESLHIETGYLLENYYDIRRKTYQVDNRTAEAKTMLIEQPLDASFTIFDTPDPAEKTLDTHRYRLEAAPGKITPLTVQERMLRSRREALTRLTYQGLQRYFEDKMLDKRAFDGLKDLLDVWAEIERLKRAIDEQQARRQAIYQAQEQAQKNMAVLSNEGEEGRLRGRYVKQLAQSEEELLQIDRAIGRINGEISQKEADVEKMIAALAG